MNDTHVGDIDVDVKSHTDKSKYGIRAMIYDSEKKQIRPHPSGYYINDNIPVDKESELASLDFKDAEERGFQKIDLLTNSSYDMFESKEEILESLNKEPDWSLLKDEKFVKTLPHIANHFELVSIIEPTSIQELADTLALMRPGKQHLIDSYLENPDRTRPNLYRKPKKGFRFKKSHAIAYACMIVCIMNKKDHRGLLIWTK